MPECFVRYDVTTQQMYEAEFRPIPRVGAGEAVASIGTRTVVPNLETERYDGAGGVRPATAQERQDLVASRLRAEATAASDGRVIRALLEVLLDEINVVRAALVPPLPARTRAEMRQALLDKYQR